MKIKTKTIALFGLILSLFMGLKDNTKTTLVKADSKNYIIDSFTGIPSDWTRYEKSVDPTSIEIDEESKELIIDNVSKAASQSNYYGSVYQFDTEVYTDFTFKMEFAVENYSDTSRFVGLLWHTNMINGYLNGLYMNYRIEGRTASSVISGTGTFTDDTAITGMPKLAKNEYHTLKVVMKGDFIFHFIDDEFITSYSAQTKYTSNLLTQDYPGSGGFGILVNRSRVRIKSINITDEPEQVNPNVTSKDHIMALFNNYNGIMGKSVPSEWATTSYLIEGVDATSAVGLKSSSGTYRAKNPDYLEFGFYDETSGWPKAEGISIRNSTDEDFQNIYQDLHDYITYESNGDTVEYPYINALITTSYISDIQDIALYFSSTQGNSSLYLIYQLEGEDTSWHLLNRDDGSYRYSPGETYGGTAVNGSWNNLVIFSGDYNGNNEADAQGDFVASLKGKTAKVGFLLASSRGPNNKIDLTGLMINRTNSIMSLVDAIEAGTIDTENERGYNILVEMGGYKMLQSQADSLEKECISSGESKYYYDMFNQYYSGVSGSKLNKETVRVFLDDWKAMRANGSNGICDYLNDSSNTTLEDLIYRFDAFDEEHQQEIRSTIDEGSGTGEIADVTIGETIDYIKSVLESKNNIDETLNSNNKILSNENNEAYLIGLLAIIGLLMVSAYYFLKKKTALSK